MIKKETQNLDATNERTYFVPMKIKFTWKQTGNSYILFIGDTQHCVASIFQKHGHWYVNPNKFIREARSKSDDYKYSPQLSLEDTMEHVENKLKDFLMSIRSK